MTSDRPFRATVESPCISVCRIDGDGEYCAGCWRTLQEVSHWRGYTDGEKRAVLEKLRERRREAGITNERDERRRVRKIRARARRG